MTTPPPMTNTNAMQERLSVKHLLRWKSDDMRNSFGELRITMREREIAPYIDQLLDLAIETITTRTQAAAVGVDLAAIDKLAYGVEVLAHNFIGREELKNIYGGAVQLNVVADAMMKAIKQLRTLTAKPKPVGE